MEKNFGLPVNPVMNHAFGPEPFNAYSLLSARTLCCLSYVGLDDGETMTSGMAVTCLRCIAISLGLSERK